MANVTREFTIQVTGDERLFEGSVAMQGVLVAAAVNALKSVPGNELGYGVTVIPLEGTFMWDQLQRLVDSGEDAGCEGCYVVDAPPFENLKGLLIGGVNNRRDLPK